MSFVCSRYQNTKSKTENSKAELGKKKKKDDKLGAKEMKPCFSGCIFLYGDQCNTILKSVVVNFLTASVLVECFKISENGYNYINPIAEGAKSGYAELSKQPSVKHLSVINIKSKKIDEVGNGIIVFIFIKMQNFSTVVDVQVIKAQSLFGATIENLEVESPESASEVAEI